jgi:hypothetical protein
MIILGKTLSKLFKTLKASYLLTSVSADGEPPICLGKTAQKLKERIDKKTIQRIDEFMMFSGYVDWRLMGNDGKRYYILYIRCGERRDSVSAIEGC